MADGRGLWVRIRAAQLSLHRPTDSKHMFAEWEKDPLQSYFSERGNRVIKWNRRGIGYPHSTRHCSERDVLVVVGLHSARRATVAPSTEWVLVLWVLLALLSIFNPSLLINSTTMKYSVDLLWILIILIIFNLGKMFFICNCNIVEFVVGVLKVRRG